MKEALKTLARAAAAIAILPQLASYRIRALFLGTDGALEASMQLLSLVPGLSGQYLRRAFLARVLAGGCAKSVVIEFGSLFSQAGSRIEENVYIGPRCHLGLVHLERDVLIAAGVHIPSGPHTHGTDEASPIRNQSGRRRLVRIGAGTWIGSNAVVMADVGRDTIVGAGAVVTQPIPPGVIAAGVPARVIRRRNEAGLASA
jgi:acetyltransferase-like isoleucine patch superfamily enzyme